MTTDFIFALVLAALALVAFSLLPRRGRVSWPVLAIAGVSAWPLLLPTPTVFHGQTAGTLVEIFGFVGSLCLVALAYRIGWRTRRAMPEIPLGLSLLLATLIASLGTLLAASATQWLLDGDSETNALPFFLVAAALLLLPDGHVLDGPDSDTAGSGATPRGLDAVHGYATLCLLPALLFLQGRVVGSQANEVAESLIWRSSLLGVLGALAAGGIAGAGASLLRERIADARRSAVLHIFAAAAPAALAEWLRPGSGAIAALASGLIVGAARWRAVPGADVSGPSPERPRSPTAWSTILAAGIFALVGTLAAHETHSPNWGGGLVLWATALGIRGLLFLAVGGFYHLLFPGRISWRWIGRGLCHSFPGVMSAAWLLANVFLLSRLSPATADGSISSLVSIVFPALLLSLLLEAATTRLAKPAGVDADRSRGWHLVRGRRIALRATQEALDLLTEQGELENISNTDREQLRANLDRRRMLADIELDELLSSSPRLREQGQRALLRELASVATRSLGEAARAGVIPRATVDTVREEVAGWLRFDRAEPGDANDGR